MSRIKQEEPLGNPILDALAPVCRWLFSVGGIACLVSLGYLFYALLIVKVANPATNQITPEGFGTIVDNLRLMGRVCVFATAVFAVALTLVYYEVKEMSAYMALLGGALYFGVPFLVVWVIGSQGGQQNGATEAILSSLQMAGKWALGVAIIRGAIAGLEWVRMGPTIRTPSIGLAKKEKASVLRQRKMNALSPCWQLPYCRDSIKERCPAYVAKRRCWKFGRGCYCDEEMIQAIVRGIGGEGDGSTQHATTGIRRSKKREGKPPCGKCYIYLEHQALKHKFLSFFMVPAAILICVTLWKPYTQVYDIGMEKGRELWNRMAFSSHMKERDRGPRVGDNWRNDGVGTEAEEILARQQKKQGEAFNLWQQRFILAMIAVFVLVYLSKALEFAIYRLHW